MGFINCVLPTPLRILRSNIFLIGQRPAGGTKQKYPRKSWWQVRLQAPKARWYNPMRKQSEMSKRERCAFSSSTTILHDHPPRPAMSSKTKTCKIHEIDVVAKNWARQEQSFGCPMPGAFRSFALYDLRSALKPIYSSKASSSESNFSSPPSQHPYFLGLNPYILTG